MAVDHDRMTTVLVELAETLKADFPIQKMLDHIVDSAVAVLGVTGAGVLLLDDDDDERFVAASNTKIHEIETLQIELREGPCVTAFRTGGRVGIPDLAHDATHPRFSPRAAEAGFGAVYTFPLRLDAERLGALDLYDEQPRRFGDDELRTAQVLADVVTAYLFNHRARGAAVEHTEALQFRALHDPLTLLANRALFVDRLEQALAAGRRNATGLGVLFLDIDRFKVVNDTYGHHVGDQLLTALAARVEPLLRPSDTLARLSGDEFVALCVPLQTREQADAVAARIASALEDPFVFDDIELTIGVSIGVATTWDDQGESELLRHADAAMYRAKRRGGNQSSVVSGGLDAEMDPRRHVVRDLKRAIDDGSLSLHYQPIVDSDAGTWCSVEALLRWEHPVLGQVPPPLVIEVAESLGLESQLERWTLETACEELYRMQDDTLTVSVNASARQLVHPRFATLVGDALEHSGLDPARLSIEITEGAFIHDVRGATQALRSVQSLGVGVALDDFGTGYSSLGLLRRLPVDTLKIDRTFVAELSSQPFDRAIVSAVVALAEVARLKVVAEGVETQDQLAVAHGLGCHQLQGYLFSPPVPAEEFALR